MSNKMNILVDGGAYRFFNTLNIEKELKPKNYVLDYDQSGNCFLRDMDSFKLPDKVYDIHKDFRDKVKKCFEHYPRNLGVLLSGNKGQGKSLNAKMLCMEMNLPVIVINKRIPKNINFIAFLNKIRQDHLVFIDEFEKLFKNTGSTSSDDSEQYHNQQIFLSYMDGVITPEHKTLFLMTTNESVNQYFLNRPSRFKFVQNYEELPEEVFDMVVDDRLENQEYKQDLKENISLVNMNIDLLISIIDDMNLFEEPFSQFKDMYNYEMSTYKYEVHRVDGNKHEWLGYKTSQYKYTASDGYICGRRVVEVLKSENGEITFTTEVVVDRTTGKTETHTLQVKLVKPSTHSSVDN